MARSRVKTQISGKEMVMDNIVALAGGSMTASMKASEEQAKEIVDRANENLRTMSKGRGYLTRGIKKQKIGNNKWTVSSRSVTDSEGYRDMPAAVEFGRGPISPRVASALYFRQLGKWRPYAKRTDPIPYFRKALAGSREELVEGIKKHVRAGSWF